MAVSHQTTNLRHASATKRLTGRSADDEVDWDTPDTLNDVVNLVRVSHVRLNGYPGEVRSMSVEGTSVVIHGHHDGPPGLLDA